MRPPVSATLAVWATAWLNGSVGYDDVLDAVALRTEAHAVVDLPASEAARHGRGEPGTGSSGHSGAPGEPSRLGRGPHRLASGRRAGSGLPARRR